MENIQATATKGGNMTNSQIFKQAHAMVKRTIQQGDDYAVTFGACLRKIKAGSEATPKATLSCVLGRVAGAVETLLIFVTITVGITLPLALYGWAAFGAAGIVFSVCMAAAFALFCWHDVQSSPGMSKDI